MITVYVGDVAEYLSNRARSEDPLATLINHSNFQNLVPGTYYVSLGDLDSLEDFASVLRQADRIVYAPPKEWSDTKKNHSRMQYWTENYLITFVGLKTVEGFDHQPPVDKDTMLTLVDTRKTEKQQVWVAGCSFTYGIGIEPHQRYGQLVADQLGLPVSFLAHPGSSLTWAADQILRSDIRPGDVVIWGLTAIERFPYFKNNKITHMSARAYEIDPTLKHKVDISFLDSQQLIYQAIAEIYQVINFCNKAGAKLVIAHVHGRGIEKYLLGLENYIMLIGQRGRDLKNLYIDLGTDDEHPGPKMNQWYCNEILKKYNELYGSNQ